MEELDFKNLLKKDLRSKGVKLKDVPNARFENGKFIFEDYFDKEMVSEQGKELKRLVNKKMYDHYDNFDSSYIEEYRKSEEDNKFWAYLKINIPDDKESAEDLSMKVSQVLEKRWEY